jgi:hypothetical protein
MWGGCAWVEEEAATWPNNKTPGTSCERTGWGEVGCCDDVVRLGRGASLLNAALSRDAHLRGSDAPSLRVLQG